jgi:hypothetical protein
MNLKRRFTMKISIRKLFVLIAIVLSFVAVQASWAHVESIEGPYTVDGTVAYVWGDRLAISCGYTIDVLPNPVGGCPFLISGMGPAGWWSVNEVAFPSAGSEVIISIYKVTTSVGDIRYVAEAVLDNGEGESILLHTPVYDGDVIYVLDSVWSKMEPLAEATILSTAATSDTDCTCKCNCKDKNCVCDCLCDSDDCGDCPDDCTCGDCDSCVPIGDEHKYQRGKK